MSAWRDAVSVRLGEYAVAKDHGRIAALGLGSCVAVLLHDPVHHVGGLAHIVLPSPEFSRERSNPTKFADEGVPFLVAEMKRAGACPERLTARLVGGSRMFDSLIPEGTVRMGERNLQSCRTALAAVGVPIVGEDVGERHGRSVVLDVAEGTVLVRAIGRSERHV